MCCRVVYHCTQSPANIQLLFDLLHYIVVIAHSLLVRINIDSYTIQWVVTKGSNALLLVVIVHNTLTILLQLERRPIVLRRSNNNGGLKMFDATELEREVSLHRGHETLSIEMHQQLCGVVGLCEAAVHG